MKKLVIAAILFLGVHNMNAQFVRFGVKAGPNFANVDGGEIDYKSRTNFHAGFVVELRPSDKVAIQPEFLYSSQGAEVEEADDFNLDYVSVPVMAKYYIIGDVLSLEVGPQFSFLVNEAESVDEAGDTIENDRFDFAVAGGIGLNITKKYFAQARYIVGLTDISREAETTNRVAQLSIGYRF
ncbi:MAG TPA: porin family protein [Flavobacterium sp.]|jgi:hypothetical protein